MTFKCPEKYRVQVAGYPRGDDRNGYFVIPLKHGQQVRVIASDGMGWEHVSVSRKDRPPLWDEMCQVKALFWGDEDCVIEYHPPRSQYVNNHPNCLHLWRPIGIELPMPDSLLVGIREAA
jgi:hypothetical protein